MRTTHKPNKTEKIQLLLLYGFSPADLLDNRVLPKPYKIQDVFEAIIKLNGGKRWR